MVDEELFTFVFTDIEGSTSLLQRFGTEYEDLLAQHHRVVRTEVAKHGGFQIGTEGDAFFLGFEDNQAALEMCVSTQVALSKENWPLEGTVRIRMGVHRGHARFAEAGWIGLGLHSAARVAATAHGGQVVVSEAAKAAGLPEGVGVFDLGPFVLKDIGKVRLYQLAHPKLPTEFPALRARPPAMSRLPAPVSSFVGRIDAIATISELARAHRLVTLVGTGGGGKTRLALQVVADRPFDDVELRTFVDLTPVSSKDGVVDEIARATAAEPPAQVAELAAHIRDRKIVLVLDACEHVIEAVTEVAAGLLRACSNLRIIATSRQALGLSGEHVIEVGALDSDDALALLRARITEAGGAITNAEEMILDELVTSLDALPLALELVAPRVRGMTVQELSRRVASEGPLRAASQGRGRRRSLDDEVRWSYELLERDERTVFARLSVLIGDVSHSLAAAVVGDDVALDVVTALEGLVTKSMVRRTAETGESRYRLLDTVRAFAVDRLAESKGEQQRFEQRYVEAVTNWLESVRALALGTAPDDAAAILDRDRHHVHAALVRASNFDNELGLRLVAAHSNFMTCGNDPALLESVFEDARDRGTSLSVPLIAAAQVALARYAGDNARDDIALNHASQAVECTEHDAPSLFAAALVARAAIEEGDEHRSMLRRAVDVARETGDTFTELDALEMLALDSARQGDLARTEELLADVYDRAGRCDFRILQDFALGSLLSLNHVLGRHAEARRYRDQGLPRWRSLGGRDLVDHLLLAAALAADEDDVALLKAFADEVQLVAARYDDEDQQADADVIRALTLASAADPSAEDALRTSLELPGEAYWMLRFRARVVLGECQLSSGDIAGARQSFVTALSTPGCLSPDLYARAMEDLAAVSLAQDNSFDATRRYSLAQFERRRTRCPIQPARRSFVASLEHACRARVGPRFAELASSAEDAPFAAEVTSVQAVAP